MKLKHHHQLRGHRYRVRRRLLRRGKIDKRGNAI